MQKLHKKKNNLEAFTEHTKKIRQKKKINHIAFTLIHKIENMYTQSRYWVSDHLFACELDVGKTESGTGFAVYLHGQNIRANWFGCGRGAEVASEMLIHRD